MNRAPPGSHFTMDREPGFRSNGEVYSIKPKEKSSNNAAFDSII
jgi:hypothetical protein